MKKYLKFSVLSAITILCCCLFLGQSSAKSFYAPFSSTKANILGTSTLINNVKNDYSVSIPSQYNWTNDGKLNYQGIGVSTSIYTHFGDNGIAVLGTIGDGTPLVTAGISKPVTLPPVKNSIEFLGTTKYFQYYVVQTVSDQYPGIGNNLAFEPGEILPSNANVAWAYYSDSPGITINYKSNDGDSLLSSENYVGELNDKFNTSPKEISGYTFKEVKGNTSGTFTTNLQTVTYIYTKNPVAGGNVTVKYVDTTGNPISDEVVKSGNVGDDYTTDQKNIAGYTFKEVQGNVTGKFTDQKQTVTYVYSKNPVAGGNVTVKYVDTTGNPISDEVVKSGNVGDGYTTDQKNIAGYTFKEVRGNAIGKFTDQKQTVTYVYSKNPESQPTPSKPVFPTTPVNPNIVGQANKPNQNSNTNNALLKASDKKGKDTLPETGATAKDAWLIVVAATLSLVSLVWFKNTKNRN